MPAKAFVIFFRYKLLLLAPFLVTIPLAIAYVLLSGSTVYQSVGKVNVERSGFLSSEATSGWNPYVSLAANQSNFVNQRLKTREFSGRVAEAASEGFFRPITEAEVRASAWASPLGETLLGVGANHADAEVARRIAQATIDEYALVAEEQTESDAAVAIEVKEAKLAERMEAAERAQQAVEAYLVTRPELVANPALGDRDAGLLRLNQTASDADRAARDAEDELIELRRFAAATAIGTERTFAAIEADAPEAPFAPLGRGMMAFVAPPVLAFLAAFSLSAIIYGFLFRTDRSLRSRDDIIAVLPNVSYLGSVPDVGSPKKRAWPRDFARVSATSGDDVEDALRRA